MALPLLGERPLVVLLLFVIVWFTTRMWSTLVWTLLQKICGHEPNLWQQMAITAFFTCLMLVALDWAAVKMPHLMPRHLKQTS